MSRLASLVSEKERQSTGKGIVLQIYAPDTFKRLRDTDRRHLLLIALVHGHKTW